MQKVIVSQEKEDAAKWQMLKNAKSLVHSTSFNVFNIKFKCMHTIRSDVDAIIMDKVCTL